MPKEKKVAVANLIAALEAKVAEQKKIIRQLKKRNQKLADKIKRDEGVTRAIDRDGY